MAKRDTPTILDMLISILQQYCLFTGVFYGILGSRFSPLVIANLAFLTCLHSLAAYWPFCKCQRNQPYTCRCVSQAVCVLATTHSLSLILSQASTDRTLTQGNYSAHCRNCMHCQLITSMRLTLLCHTVN